MTFSTKTKLLLVLLLATQVHNQCTRLGQVENSGNCICDASKEFQAVTGRDECECTATNFLLFSGDECGVCIADSTQVDGVCQCNDAKYLDNAGVCSDCGVGTVPDGAKRACVDPAACPTGEIINGGSTMCLSCIHGCNVCVAATADSACTTCQDGAEKKADNSLCRLPCTVDHCAVCAESGDSTCH